MPYDLIMGYMPQVNWLSIPSQVPAVTAQIEELDKIRDNTLKAIAKAQADMRRTWSGSKRFKPYNKGNQVWVKGTNLRTLDPTRKLGQRQYRPFKVLKRLSDAVYWVELPKQWKIHTVFHTDLITPYKETELHGPNFTQPPPDLIDGEEEYKVEKILDMKQKGQGHKMHYLIKWKGYPTSDNSWEPAENVQAKDLIKEYKEEQRRQDKGKARN
jgi:hypothetical protein